MAKNRRFDPRKRGFEPLTEKEDQVDAFARADPGERLRLPEKAEGGEQGLRVMDALREWANNDKSPEFFALLGEYGMGKTTTCLRFYQELRRKREAAEPAREPLLFNLKEVSVVGDRGRRWKRLCRNAWSAAGTTIAKVLSILTASLTSWPTAPW